MKLLLVEDNLRFADRIKNLLKDRYLVDVVATGQEALQKVSDISYSLIILDLGLPDMPGDEVCQKIRNLGITAPIIVLTGDGNIKSRVQLLQFGADDYMTKPFHGEELQARLTALLRRSAFSYTKPRIIHGDLVIDTDQRKVYRSGSAIALRRKEFDILEYLFNNRGRVVTREMIMNHAWDSSKSTWRGTVNVHIKHLRDKLDQASEPSVIKTVYGMGYRVDVPE